MSVIKLSYIVLSSHLAQSFVRTIGISLIPPWQAEEHEKSHHFLINMSVPKFPKIVLEAPEYPKIVTHLIYKYL